MEDNKVLEKYQSELTDDIHLSVNNLREKSLLISSIRAKWLNYYFLEKRNLAKIAETKQKIIDNKTKSSASQSLVRLKTEESLVGSDPRITELNNLQKKTKDNIDYIERAMSILGDFGFQVKNSIEILKLEKL